MQNLSSSSSLDEYFDFVSRKGTGIAIIVKENELSFLKDGSNHWILSFGHPIFVLRASLSDFEVLEIGVHPKVLVFENGEEIGDFDGIPTYRQLKAVLR